MELNPFIFPAPDSSYTADEFPEELMFIPKISYEEGEAPCIPCLYLPYQQGSKKLLVYFHGNAEDLGLARELLEHLRS